ncbi:hypothetical protein F4680DRAFT_416949 [Xylaria scruposa]|nr:hypothetical protein F4680DRAFT_416949 [Xylaria scruposa]
MVEPIGVFLCSHSELAYAPRIVQHCKPCLSAQRLRYQFSISASLTPRRTRGPYQRLAGFLLISIIQLFRSTIGVIRRITESANSRHCHATLITTGLLRRTEFQKSLSIYDAVSIMPPAFLLLFRTMPRCSPFKIFTLIWVRRQWPKQSGFGSGMGKKTVWLGKRTRI